MKIVFDIDSTLANTDHRHHFITEGSPKNWDAFFEAAVDDTPITHAVTIYKALVKCNSIEFWTGRPERYRITTRKWLRKHIGSITESCVLKMRAKGDFRDDDIIKPEFIDPTYPPEVIFEDRKRVVDAYRAKGMIVYQIAPGNF